MDRRRWEEKDTRRAKRCRSVKWGESFGAMGLLLFSIWSFSHDCGRSGCDLRAAVGGEGGEYCGMGIIGISLGLG